MIAPSFSVVVPTRDRPAQLARCLGSLAHSTYPRDSYEVLVVNDGGTTDAQRVVRKFDAAMRVKLIQSSHRGPAAARNAGVGASAGDLVAFTDDDCTVDTRWLERLATRLTSTPGAMVGGRVLNELAANRYSRASQGLQDFLYRWYHQDNGGELRFFTTNNVALRREDFERIGGFDETFTFASEDRDLSDRALAAGLKLLYEPEAVVHHAHDLGLRDFLRQHFQYGQGAAHFHSRRRARRRNRVRLERPAFYFGMLTSAYRSGSPEPFIGSLLLVASQSASLLGAIRGAATRALGSGRA